MKAREWLGLAIALAVAATTDAADARAEAWCYVFDLRNLPAQTRPAAAVAELDMAEPAAAGERRIASLAVNGTVIARRTAQDAGRIAIEAPLQDRLLSTRNVIELAVSSSGCGANGCPERPGTTRPAGPVRFRLGSPQGEVDDFSQLVTAYRAGIALTAEGPRAEALAALARGALAPAAAIDPGASARLHVAATPPAGTRPLLRFDRGPVRLVRSDGVEEISARVMETMTSVQILAGRDRPMIWIRPGSDAQLPATLELSEGDIALFDRAGRAIAFSSRRDHHALRIDYTAGFDPYGADERMLIWRLVLLGLWLAASIFLFVIYRRLAPPQVSQAAR